MSRLFALRPFKHMRTIHSRIHQMASQLNPAPAAAYNFGPASGDAWPVRQVVETVAHLWGPDARWSADEDGAMCGQLLQQDAAGDRLSRRHRIRQEKQ